VLAAASFAVSAGMVGVPLPFLGTAKAAAPKSGGHLRVATPDSSASDLLDPHRGASFTDYLRQAIVFEKLTDYDHDGKLVPRLAVSWGSNKEGTQWSFELRQGVTFHNGKTMTSADVVESFRRARDAKTGSANRSRLDLVTEIKEDGPNRVTFVLATPSAELPQLLTVRGFTVAPIEATEFPKQAWGTGPWRVKQFEPGLSALFERNKSYWVAGRPYIDDIESVGISDDNARANALLSGEIDLVQNLNATLVKRVNGSDAARAVVTIGTAHASYPMRADTAPFDNPDVRTALKHAFDRQHFIDLAFDGLGGVGRDSPVSPLDPEFCAEVPIPERDPDKVKFFLKKAGHENTVFELHSSDVVYGGANAAVTLGELMRESGVNVDVKRDPADGYWKAVYMKAPWCASSWIGQPTAVSSLENGYVSTAKLNETFWHNETFDKLVAQAKVELDAAKRKQLLCEAQMLLSQDGSQLIPVFVPWIDGQGKRVQDFRGHPREGLGGGQWQDVWLTDS